MILVRLTLQHYPRCTPLAETPTRCVAGFSINSSKENCERDNGTPVEGLIYSGPLADSFRKLPVTRVINKDDLVLRLVEYERLRSAPAGDGGAAGGPPRELEAEATRQLVDDLVSALELAEEDDEDEEPQEHDDLVAGDSVDCDGDVGLDEDD